MNERHSLEDLHQGPFVFENEYYDALVSAFLQQANLFLLLLESLSRNCFSSFSKPTRL